jgi:hypothetical protein
MPLGVETLEQQLDSFDPAKRREALDGLVELVRRGDVQLPASGGEINVHTHTFFSYNAYGYSPTKYAWLARKRGLAVAGIVDFDVLDGLEEFLEAGRALGLKACVSVETRVYVPEFADRVMTSPGEPGISYHMGVGFTTAHLGGWAADFLASMRQGVDRRNRALVGRVNAYTGPAVLDYDKDVVPLTPKCNPTERHICLAYARRAAETFPEAAKLADFWVDKLGELAEKLDLPDGPKLQNSIRAKMMKRGGVGYVQPDRGSFPLMADMNRFVLDAGAIPTMTWLDGTSAGEQAMEELIEVAKSTGTAALNIIPDRNYTPGVKDQKLQNLYAVVALAEKHGFPIIVGTEMNSPGQKFVDAFDTAELKPLLPVFLKGACIAYAHSVMQREAGMGYLSDWAKRTFATVGAKNEFFHALGRLLQPKRESNLRELPANVTPAAILGKTQ